MPTTSGSLLVMVRNALKEASSIKLCCSFVNSIGTCPISPVRYDPGEDMYTVVANLAFRVAILQVSIL